jgi:hypothetical protein
MYTGVDACIHYWRREREWLSREIKKKMKKLIGSIFAGCLMITAASAHNYQIVPDYTYPTYHGFLVRDLSSGAVVASYYQGSGVSGGYYAPWVWDPQNLLHITYSTFGQIENIEIN